LKTHKHLIVLTCTTYDTWLAWLDRNHRQTQGVWVKYAKKDTGTASISYEQSREAAIIYGWIDGLINGLDKQFYLRKFTPRRPRSKWSKINREIAETLIDNGKMKPSGMQEVLAAKKDGRWDVAYDSQSTIAVPPRLQRLLDTNSKAKENFENLSSNNRYAFLYRIQTAKLEKTKQKHIEKAFDMLKQGETYHPQRKSKPTTAIKKKK